VQRNKKSLPPVIESDERELKIRSKDTLIGL
jgi:hypothetical protein